jgi:cholest-4-en-3-one 26-monooxygenase
MKPGDLDLFDVDNFNEGFPHHYFEVLRRHSPVHWQPAPPLERQHTSVMPIREGFFAITRYEDVVQVSRSPDVFSSELGGTNLWDPEPAQLDALRNFMLNMDPPKHAKYRRIVSRTFTPRAVQNIEPAIRRHATRIVDEICHHGECDFVTKLACELPLVLICEFLGFPQEDRHRVFDWSNRMIGFDDPEYQADVSDREKAAMELYLYANEIAAQKRGEPDESLVSKLVNGDVDGEKLTEHEFNSFVLLLAVAGNETTRNATSHGMRLLSEHPEQYEILRSDPERYVPSFIEEVLRYSPSVIHFRRTVTQETELRGVRMPRGTKVGLFYGSANRDEDVFQDPNRFDVTRDPNPHLAFGVGEHFCLGASLARMQLRTIFHEVVTRLPDMNVSEAPRRLRGNFIDGIKEMKVRYTPQPRA